MPLVLSQFSPHLGVITAVINAGANVNTQSRGRFTPLMTAAAGFFPNSAMITALINVGTSVNARSDDRRTPLRRILRLLRTPLNTDFLRIR